MDMHVVNDLVMIIIPGDLTLHLNSGRHEPTEITRSYVNDSL